jgi:dTDP-4-amino-4,6-dideoxygalactose transaminase
MEDAAHAHGSEWKGKRLGALGDVGSFSFQASKCITAGEGGAIVSNNKELLQRCDSYIWAGREVGRPWYEFHRLGWNYRITEFQGAILRAQLKRLDSQIELRTENVEYIKKRFESEIECLKLLKRDSNATRHSYHLVMAKYNPEVLGVSKDVFVDALAAEGIAVVKGYSSPIYKNPMFINQDFYPKGCPINCCHYGKTIDYASFEASCPVSERACSSEAAWFDQRMFLGTKEDMDDIVNAILKVQNNVNELKR